MLKMGDPSAGVITGLTVQEIDEVKVLNAGSPQAGLAYAKEVCAACHSISDGKSSEPEATAFSEIADVPGMSAKALLVWMHTQHPTMPNIALKGEDLMDVVAYILSLKTLADKSETDIARGDGTQSKIDNPEAIAMLGNPQAGLAYAKQWCSGCHGVSGEKSPNSKATAFSKVANVQGMSAKSLLVWMNVIHPTMPSITPEREDLMNVIAYILSQKDEGNSDNQ